MEKLEHRVKPLLYSIVHSIVHSTLPVHFPVQRLETPWLIEPHQLWSLHGKFSIHVQCNIKMLPYLIQSIPFIELVYVPFTDKHDTMEGVLCESFKLSGTCTSNDIDHWYPW